MRRFNPPKFNAPAAADGSEAAGKPAKRNLAPYNEKAPGQASEAREPLKERDKNAAPEAANAGSQYYKVLYTKRNINKVGVCSVFNIFNSQGPPGYDCSG